MLRDQQQQNLSKLVELINRVHNAFKSNSSAAALSERYPYQAFPESIRSLPSCHTSLCMCEPVLLTRAIASAPPSHLEGKGRSQRLRHRIRLQHNQSRLNCDRPNFEKTASGRSLTPEGKRAIARDSGGCVHCFNGEYWVWGCLERSLHPSQIKHLRDRTCTTLSPKGKRAIESPKVGDIVLAADPVAAATKDAKSPDIVRAFWQGVKWCCLLLKPELCSGVARNNRSDLS
jgi:hypothetical protein